MKKTYKGYSKFLKGKRKFYIQGDTRPINIKERRIQPIKDFERLQHEYEDILRRAFLHCIKFRSVKVDLENKEILTEEDTV